MSADDALEHQFWPPGRRSQSKAPKVIDFGGGHSERAGTAAAAGPSSSLLRAELRAHIRHAPQVLVKITGGSRGMAGITAHLKYISDKGVRVVEDQDGERHRGEEAINELRLQWRDSGSQLPWVSDRKQAHHILLQMPAGTDAERLIDAARGFARAEFDGHLYAMALHTHQSTPHVHLIVRTEAANGQRLNPRKADLHRWRLRFAHELRERGIDAAASRQRTRGYAQRHEQLWEKKIAAREEELLRKAGRAHAMGDLYQAAQLVHRAAALRTRDVTRPRARSHLTEHQVAQARAGWEKVRDALGRSLEGGDPALARDTGSFITQVFERSTPAPTPGRGR